ncbi:MAG: hypothetical protein LBM98_04835 [Oscillospiraceae bacterium]|nr:hypothetical protein [Oscillospiraceae bacterium]
MDEGRGTRFGRGLRGLDCFARLAKTAHCAGTLVGGRRTLDDGRRTVHWLRTTRNPRATTGRPYKLFSQFIGANIAE